ncbi:MAG: hypothetical protein ETSY1_07405 [Candidatus Entotheonella factor]|uniref:Uncharacterized protein n=1 Tax=Entotheonella factor TaxID=1429438 RepID=W4LUR8_ENTF1|nr:MAG: hypothetical protein ETSY1_07405 [Candidatus Entotheonella factor]
MDRVILGDNQFFGVNHMSEEKARAQAMRFSTVESMMHVIDSAMEAGINSFMCTTHDRVAEICDHMRANPAKYAHYSIYPCMPYAYKYANAMTELGVVGALRQFALKDLFSMALRGSRTLVTRNFTELILMLIDAEMNMFKQLNTEVIFIQNITVDLLLGLGMREPFIEFARHVDKKYGAEPAFQSMNLPMLLQALDECDIKNPIVCSSINKIGFRMSGGIRVYENLLREKKCRPIAMSVFASGAIPPKDAIDYVCGIKEIESIVFGASTPAHIEETKTLIDELSY